MCLEWLCKKWCGSSHSLYLAISYLMMSCLGLMGLFILAGMSIWVIHEAVITYDSTLQEHKAEWLNTCMALNHISCPVNLEQQGPAEYTILAVQWRDTCHKHINRSNIYETTEILEISAMNDALRRIEAKRSWLIAHWLDQCEHRDSWSRWLHPMCYVYSLVRNPLWAFWYCFICCWGLVCLGYGIFYPYSYCGVVGRAMEFERRKPSKSSSPSPSSSLSSSSSSSSPSPPYSRFDYQQPLVYSHFDMPKVPLSSSSLNNLRQRSSLSVNSSVTKSQ